MTELGCAQEMEELCVKTSTRNGIPAVQVLVFGVLNKDICIVKGYLSTVTTQFAWSGVTRIKSNGSCIVFAAKFKINSECSPKSGFLNIEHAGSWPVLKTSRTGIVWAGKDIEFVKTQVFLASCKSFLPSSPFTLKYWFNGLFSAWLVPEQ